MGPTGAFRVLFAERENLNIDLSLGVGDCGRGKSTMNVHLYLNVLQWYVSVRKIRR